MKYRLTLKADKSQVLLVEAMNIHHAKTLGAQSLGYPHYQAMQDWGNSFLVKAIKEEKEDARRRS